MVWDLQIQTTKHKIDKYKYLLCVTSNYIQYFIITYNGKLSEKITELFCVYLKLLKYCKSTIFQ